MSSMTLDAFGRNFPDGHVPPALRKLFEYQQAEPAFFSGTFEVTLSPWGDPQVFAGVVELAKQFAVFGKEADGSLYALWLHEGRAADEAPVVFIDSEGAESTVVASDLRAFIALLTVGDSSLGRSRAALEPPEDEAARERLGRFRKWARRTLGIAVPRDPEALVEDAIERHHDLQDFFDAQFDNARDGEKRPQAIESQDRFLKVLGKPGTSDEVRQFIEDLGGRVPRAIRKDSYVELKKQGISLLFGDQREVSAIFLYGRPDEGFRPYDGPLPHRIQFSWDRSTAHASLGNPASSGAWPPDSPWDVHAFPGYTVHLQYRRGEDSIARVQLQST